MTALNARSLVAGPRGWFRVDSGHLSAVAPRSGFGADSGHWRKYLELLDLTESGRSL